MDLRHLKHFICVVEAGSFSGAASRLGLTQSALSRSLQALEHSLGIQLLDRMGKRSELTPLGRVVYERGQRAIFEADEITEDLQRLQSLGLGSLNVGLGPWPSALLATPLLRHVAEHHPGLRLQLSRYPVDTQLEELRARKLDALVIDPRMIASPIGLRLENVTDFRAAFLCRPGHPLAAAGRPVKFKELLPFPIASSPFSTEASRALISQYGANGAADQLLTLSCEEWSSMMELARTTDAIHIGTLALAHPLLERGELVELPVLPKLKGTVRIALVTLARRTEAPALAVVREFVGRQLRETAQRVK